MLRALGLSYSLILHPQVKESAGESVLAIKNIQTDQSGTYVCEIKEMESDLIASTQIELIVEGEYHLLRTLRKCPFGK